MVGWYAAYVPPRKELAVCGHLVDRGVKTYCPMVSELRRRRRRESSHVFKLVEVTVAAFPRYVFIEAGNGFWKVWGDHPLERISVVSAGGVPLVIPDLIIQGIKELVDMTPNFSVLRMPLGARFRRSNKTEDSCRGELILNGPPAAR